jgi:hypothetical protein
MKTVLTLAAIASLNATSADANVAKAPDGAGNICQLHAFQEPQAGEPAKTW